jgi:hypothetical protein
VTGPRYLTGARYYLRAPVNDDVAFSASWFPSVFPVSVGQSERYLKDQLKRVWWASDPFHLVVARVEDDQVVGGVIIKRPSGPGAEISLRFAPALGFAEGDRIQANALELLVPWLLNEAEVLTITVNVGADQARTLDAAAQLGMSQQVRLREFLARPGGRIDMIQLQALNQRRAARVAEGGDQR